MTGRPFAQVIAIAWLAAAALPAHAERYPIALLKGLHKVTARVITLEAPVGETITFGTLEIIVRACDKRPPEEPPESAAFLDIWETRPGEPALTLFRGWMFASSPALSAVEHPIYDVWVVGCRDADNVRNSSSGESSRRN